ncbi:hypothetical protein KJ657_05410 [Patescibacteria group bacterium]|nr:hypothetical protein [Patescibacteria group bacterium]MBU1016495.1 hypothetical protein [Patescibacteria group bacterium]MBU1685126.1 hypothetical protein [Patescibacteria group bacterium]MBU1938626.1 hypothetical protein [Patescibacteria group bacterium]
MQTELGQVNNFGEFISLIWAFGSRAIIAFAIFFIVLGAFYYIASAGNEEKIEQGKEMVYGSLIAIAIVLLSGVLIRILHQPTQGVIGHLSELPEVIGNATNILVSLIGAFSFLMLAYAGFLYLTGGGEKTRIMKAHRAFAYSIYGLIVGVLAYGIANTVIKFLI